MFNLKKICIITNGKLSNTLINKWMAKIIIMVDLIKITTQIKINLVVSNLILISIINLTFNIKTIFNQEFFHLFNIFKANLILQIWILVIISNNQIPILIILLLKNYKIRMFKVKIDSKMKVEKRRIRKRRLRKLLRKFVLLKILSIFFVFL